MQKPPEKISFGRLLRLLPRSGRLLQFKLSLILFQSRFFLSEPDKPPDIYLIQYAPVLFAADACQAVKHLKAEAVDPGNKPVVKVPALVAVLPVTPAAMVKCLVLAAERARHTVKALFFGGANALCGVVPHHQHAALPALVPGVFIKP